MRHVVPVLTVVLAIVVIWYAAAVGLNRAWIYDQAARAGVEPATGMALVVETWNQERPVLPAPHQVVTELVKSTFGMAPTSKRSLVYHGWITLSATVRPSSTCANSSLRSPSVMVRRRGCRCNGGRSVCLALPACRCLVWRSVAGQSTKCLRSQGHLRGKRRCLGGGLYVC